MSGKKIMKRISRNEWTLVTITTIFLIAMTTVPFLYGYFRTPPDRYFLGIHSLAPGDYSVYFSYILQFYEGHFFLSDLFTNESVSYNMLNTFWDFAGALGKILYLNPLWAFHAARVFSIPILTAALYVLAGFIYEDIKKRKITFLFLLFATGIGAYVETFFSNAQYIEGYYHKPMDLWVAESNIFLSMLHSGHMTLSWALTIFALLAFLKAEETRNIYYSFIAGACTLVLISFHPFMFPVIAVILLAYIMVQSVMYKKIPFHNIMYFLLIIFISFPVLVYYFLMLSFDPITQNRALQNTSLTTASNTLFISYGFLFLFAIIGLYQFFQKTQYKDRKKLFLAVWFFAQLILIYMPLNYQRRLIEGLQIPVVFFAIEGLWYVWRLEYRSRILKFLKNCVVPYWPLAFFLSLFTFFASNMYVYARDMALYIAVSPYVYMPRGIADAMIWTRTLDENIVILAHANTAHFIPGIAGKRVYAGHVIETPYFYKKENEIFRFFTANSYDEAKKAFLRKNAISHIFFGLNEKSLSEFRPDEKEYLKKVFENQSAAIYEVVKEKINL